MTEHAPVEYAHCPVCGAQLSVPTRYMSVETALATHREVEHA